MKLEDKNLIRRFRKNVKIKYNALHVTKLKLILIVDYKHSMCYNFMERNNIASDKPYNFAADTDWSHNSWI